MMYVLCYLTVLCRIPQTALSFCWIRRFRSLFDMATLKYTVVCLMLPSIITVNLWMKYYCSLFFILLYYAVQFI